MNDNPYNVAVATPEETEAFLLKQKRERTFLGKPFPQDHRKIMIDGGIELKGEFELTARDARSGEVEWQHAQENLITDCGRQAYFDLGLTNWRIGFMPSTETPHIVRCSVPTDGSQCFVSANLGSGTVTPSTFTKQWSTTFGTPGANRTLGSIFTSYFSGTAFDGNLGVVYIWSYSLLTPPKTQTTTQTLEVVYKISMNPIF